MIVTCLLPKTSVDDVPSKVVVFRGPSAVQQFLVLCQKAFTLTISRYCPWLSDYVDEVHRQVARRRNTLPLIMLGQYENRPFKSFELLIP